jgi:hypothetical protein
VSSSPFFDLPIVAGPCSGLAPFPRVGWVPATVTKALLITRVTDADPWPDAVILVVGSNVFWRLT